MDTYRNNDDAVRLREERVRAEIEELEAKLGTMVWYALPSDRVEVVKGTRAKLEQTPKEPVERFALLEVLRSELDALVKLLPSLEKQLAALPPGAPIVRPHRDVGAMGDRLFAMDIPTFGGDEVGMFEDAAESLAWIAQQDPKHERRVADSFGYISFRLRGVSLQLGLFKKFAGYGIKTVNYALGVWVPTEVPSFHVHPKGALDGVLQSIGLSKPAWSDGGPGTSLSFSGDRRAAALVCPEVREALVSLVYAHKFSLRVKSGVACVRWNSEDRLDRLESAAAALIRLRANAMLVSSGP